MKKVVSFLCFMVFALTASFSQNIPPAPEDKAVVYFLRPYSLGFAINFSYFDGDQLVGRFKGNKYTRYECEPGTHLFWARSENRDFIEADVEAGKIYFIEAKPRMGGLKAAVFITPVDPKTHDMKRIVKLMNKRGPETFTAEKLAADQADLAVAIENGLQKYKEHQDAGKVFKKLEKGMFYTE